MLQSSRYAHGIRHSIKQNFCLHFFQITTNWARCCVINVTSGQYHTPVFSRTLRADEGQVIAGFVARFNQYKYLGALGIISQYGNCGVPRQITTPQYNMETSPVGCVPSHIPLSFISEVRLFEQNGFVQGLEALYESGSIETLGRVDFGNRTSYTKIVIPSDHEIIGIQALSDLSSMLTQNLFFKLAPRCHPVFEDVPRSFLVSCSLD